MNQRNSSHEFQHILQDFKERFIQDKNGQPYEEKELLAQKIGAISVHFDELIDIAKTALSFYGNEENYPPGTNGYQLAAKARNALFTMTKK